MWTKREYQDGRIIYFAKQKQQLSGYTGRQSGNSKGGGLQSLLTTDGQVFEKERLCTLDVEWLAVKSLCFLLKVHLCYLPTL